MSNKVWVVERLMNGRWKPWTVSWITKKEADWSLKQCCVRYQGSAFRVMRYVPAESESARPCTCHPDDSPPNPCPQKFALSECVTAAAHDNKADVMNPHPMLEPTHICKDCGVAWRQCDDFTFNLRGEKACPACDNAPVGGQLVSIASPLIREINTLRARLAEALNLLENCRPALSEMRESAHTCEDKAAWATLEEDVWRFIDAADQSSVVPEEPMVTYHGGDPLQRFRQRKCDPLPKWAQDVQDEAAIKGNV